MKKRVFSLLLVCIMLLSLLPVSALAEEGDTPEPDQTVSTEQEADPIEDQSSNQLTDPDPEGEADTDLLSDGNAIVQEEDQIAPDSEEKEEDTAVEDTAPAAEPVRVVFVCEPTNLLLTVFAKSETEKTIQPEGDGAYLLLPGEYFYTATAEGYVPAENIPFMVEASEEPLQFFVVLTAEQDETAMEPSSDDHEDGLESQMPEALSDDPEGETEPEVSETDPGDSEGELEPETPETPDVPENETPTEEGPELQHMDSNESNAEMFAKYVDQMFRNLGKERTRSMPTPDARLTAAGFAAEQAIKRMIQEVARGERTSTFFEIDISEYGYDLDDIEENDLDILVYVLMADCTNELYWFGHSWYNPWKSADGKTIYMGLCVGMPFRADPDDAFTVDTSAINRANTAVANAQAIIDRYASGSDYDKLHGYKNEICRLNVYNYDAAEASNDYTIFYPNEVDNNPWELVYVFDNDPETNVVCEGYAKAFEYLCDHSSFRSRLINAYCVTGINHKWNIVTMNDGKNYLVDVTWCDDEYSETGNDEWFLRPWCGANGEAPSFDSFCINVYGGYLSERSYDQETQCSYSASALTLSETEYDPNAPDVYLRITTQPVDFEGHIGDTAVFTVAAEGDGLTYQWQWYNGSVWANSGITGNKTPTASTKITQTKLAYQYRCVITDENGNTVTSNAVRMILKQPIMITAQPVDFEGRIGDTAVFTVVAEGDGLTYQWQWYNGSVWANSGITGNKTPTASTKITQTKLAYQYRCVITDENGNTVTSDAVRMILKQPIVITSQPVDFEGRIGDTAVFTVVAEGDGLTYQWQWFNGTSWANSGITGNKKPTASTKITQAKLAYQYRCVITDENENTVTSDAVRMILLQPSVQIISQPVDFVGDVGDTAVFTVVAEGDGLTYQWQWFNGTEWVNSGITGNKTATASTKVTQTKLGYQYRCVITDQYGNEAITDAVRIRRGYNVITFNANGGWLNGDESITEVSYDLVWGEPLSTLPEPSADHPEGIRNKFPRDWNSNPEGTGDPIDWDYVPTSDMTFYVEWVQSANILLHANGGRIDFDGTILDYMRSISYIGAEVEETWSQDYLVTTDREFLGWYYEPECVNLAIAPGGMFVTTEPEVHLYAKWADAPGRTVTFHANGGVIGYRTYEETSFFVKEGNVIGFEVDVEHEDSHMIFTGWNLAADGSGQAVDVYSYVPVEDVTLYAQWEAGYIITLDGNGGWFWDDPNTTVIIEKVQQGLCFWESWYSYDIYQTDLHMGFERWYLDAACTEPVPFDENGRYFPTEDITFYVGWAEGWIVTWDANGGVVGGGQETLTRVILKGKAVGINWTVEKFGMYFDGWYTDPAFSEESRVDEIWNYVPASDMTFYAKWAPGYTIVLNANGGWFWQNRNQTIVRETIRQGDYFGSDWYWEVLHQTDPRMGFDGWYLDAACTQPVPFDANGRYYPTGNMTFYAGWAPGWIVTWDANGGVVGGIDEILTMTICDGRTAISWIIEKDGAAFDGWYTDPEFSPESRVDEMWAYVITADVTFYAKWAPAYRVTFDANGGWFWSDRNETVIYEMIRQGDYFTSDWYSNSVHHTDSREFGGWYLDAACTQPVPFDAYDRFYPAGDMIVYAKWVPIYTIILDANGGCYLGDPDYTVVVEQVIMGGCFWGYWYSENLYHADEQKDFAGWYMDAACTEPIPLVDGYCYPNGDMTIYAKWSTIYILTQPTNCWGEIGDTATFTVEASGEGLTYQWQWYNGSVWANSSITGNKTSTASTTITEAKLKYQYRCVITDQNGDSVITIPVRIKLIREANLGENQAQVSHGLETYLSFTPIYSGYYMIESIGSVDTMGSLYLGDDCISDDDDSGEGNNFRIVQYLETGTRYRIGVQTYSENYVGTLTFLIRDLFIMEQPTDYFGDIGETATFHVEARGRGLTYQWQWYNGSVWANSGITGNKTSAASTKITEAKLAYQYRCKITDESGATIYSDPVRMVRILDAVLGENQVQVEGGKERLLTFTPEYSGYYLIESIGSLDTVGYLYQGDDNIAYDDDDGENCNFRLIQYLEAGTKYRIGVRTYSSGYTGELTFVISGFFISSQPQDYVGSIGDTATFHVEAEGEGLTYQWQWYNGTEWADSGISGNKTATASTKITQTKLGYQYRCVIKDALGNSIVSNAVRMIKSVSD